ncbi:hypothetical protein [Cohnella zeiphila]|uniref:Uncharacterized protein n=1 Tax=Cohnella zeiphila TaxID=2761120 RepID=A0A7X0VYT2_9BACL|nr:hypothetical protein [Cohnella zeiphila]MBB6735684.1 hypothetical protein [Cohnella zeiphila]
MNMQLTQNSLELRKAVKSLKEMNLEDSKLQSTSFMDSVPLSMQEKSAVKKIFSAKVTGNHEDGKIKMGNWL